MKIINQCVLNFWGVLVKVSFEHPRDYENVLFFYKDFVCEEYIDINIEIVIKSNNGESGIETLLHDVAFNYASYKLSNMKDYNNWNSKSTIIPPFSLPPLNNKFLLLHGGVIQNSYGSNIAVMASHYSGKTTTVLNCIDKYGCKYFTEDLIILNRDTYRIFPINKPAGIRKGTLSKVQDLLNKVENISEKRLYFSNVTGDIFVLQISKMFENSFCNNPVRLNHIIILNNDLANTFSIQKLDEVNSLKILVKHIFKNSDKIEDNVKKLIGLVRLCDIWQVNYNLENELHRENLYKNLGEMK